MQGPKRKENQGPRTGKEILDGGDLLGPKIGASLQQFRALAIEEGA